MKKLSQELAEGSIVLLKNDGGLLPLSPGSKVSVFGRAQIKTVFSGNGSGAVRCNGKCILNALYDAGINPEPVLSSFYRKEAAKEPEDIIDWDTLIKTGNSGFAYEIFGRYHAPFEEYDISKELMAKVRNYSDTALLVIGRSAGGEECDRHLYDDYLLTKSEMQLVKQVCGAFEKVVLILNINGLVDLGFIKEYPAVKSVIFMGIAGEDGSSAIADILVGKISPSGKLAFTIAEHYEDYPSSKDFSFDKNDPLTYESYGLSAKENGSVGFDKSPVTVYREGIYTGYRYFDTFNVQPLFPFGHGLSYTSFSLEHKKVEKKTALLSVTVRVTNIGKTFGREVIQLYAAPKNPRIEQPAKKLWGFEKTKLLVPKESEEITIELPLRELAVYEEDSAAWIIQKDVYLIELGSSSQNTENIGGIAVKEDILLKKCVNRLGLRECNRGKIRFLRHIPEGFISPGFENVLKKEDIGRESTMLSEECCDFFDFSTEELAALCVGYGPGVPFSAFCKDNLPNTVCGKDGSDLTESDHPTGRLGYVSPAMPKRGIHSISYADGPAGVGETIWPSEMLLACSFDRELWYRFGDMAGKECEEKGIDVWLAPAVNLHRNPLCGRNFEYFSEDPLLTGICAVEIARGLQENHSVLVCPKHFAANEQETYRRGSAKLNYDAADSIMEERVLHEIYLKPFEMLVKNVKIACIMTSFNKINGTFSAGSRDLCTHILREDWGFHGAVVSDWGDMDTVADGADAIKAGNDIVMPGGPPVIKQILNGCESEKLRREDLETAVLHLLVMLKRLDKFK